MEFGEELNQVSAVCKLDFNTYSSVYNKVRDHINESFDVLKPRSSFKEIISFLLGDIPFNVNGALYRFVVLEPNYKSATNLIIAWKYSRENNIIIEFHKGESEVIDKDIRLDKLMKKLKRMRAI